MFVFCRILSLGAYKVIPKVNIFQFKEETSSILFKNPVRTAQYTLVFSVIATNQGVVRVLG